MSADQNAKRLNDVLKERFKLLDKQAQLNLDAEKRIKEVRDIVEKQLKELREDIANSCQKSTRR